ncbi:MAG: hypothetical protein CVU39_04815 [Chloroflexi bacterium HGW-Chloroflexi-10]|nr:MAG: hypothetical protein CVU39_04815 [Chloroflexi bacterium HGW-Chloroflexi-10]
MNKKVSFVIVMVVLSGLLLSACGVKSPTTDFTRQINVSGKGEVYLIPDIAYVNIGVRSEELDVATALSENNTQAKAIATVLSDLGVDPKDIQTTAFNVYPFQNYGPDGMPSDTKYVVENTVYVKVRELDKLGELLDAVVRKGANTINGIQFDVQDRAQAESDARRLAVQDATNKATELADVAGVQLGDILSINVYSSGTPIPMYDAKGGGYNADMSAAPIASGQLVITADANMTYQLK